MNRGRPSARRRSSRALGLLRHPLPAWTVALLHLLALGVALVLFALPHHVIPHRGASTGITSSRDALPAAASAAEPVRPALTLDERIANARQTEVGLRVADDFKDQFTQQLAAIVGSEAPEAPGANPHAGDFTSKFSGKFSDGVSETENSYVSPNLNI